MQYTTYLGINLIRTVHTSFIESYSFTKTTRKTYVNYRLQSLSHIYVLPRQTLLSALPVYS